MRDASFAKKGHGSEMTSEKESVTKHRQDVTTDAQASTIMAEWRVITASETDMDGKHAVHGSVICVKGKTARILNRAWHQRCHIEVTPTKRIR